MSKSAENEPCPSDVFPLIISKSSSPNDVPYLIIANFSGPNLPKVIVVPSE